jgi:lysophospholipase
VGKPYNRRAIPAGAKESTWVTADGHKVRRIDWPPPAGRVRGSILFLPGRGDFYEKYLEALDHWHQRGWHVTASDWRGQGASGRLGKDPYTGHIDDFATWVDDLALLWRQWQGETPGPHVLAGHSMGGHLALRTAAAGKVQPDALLLTAPMLGFVASLLPAGVMHVLTKVMKALGDPRRPAWKWSEKPGEPPQSREYLLTHDPARYSDELWWRGERPELVIGPGSWNWVERAYASMRGLLAPGVLEAVRVPVLILASDADKLVGFEAIARAAVRLPDCQLIHFGEEAAHEILREEDRVRGRALAACDAFLERISGA